ncbi:hypothetical protein CEXT_504831 [Caerostris extrusa]|uniref:Uncharacterized protein n=1 Tax=Caerostris extrusa TaxID=172846 RepID=A0AAV4TWG7_CAEEX|nr:hypothetical protein CEXT_504831 [Caerostris extrusa]
MGMPNKTYVSNVFQRKLKEISFMVFKAKTVFFPWLPCSFSDKSSSILGSLAETSDRAYHEYLMQTRLQSVYWLKEIVNEIAFCFLSLDVSDINQSIVEGVVPE